MHIVLWDTRQRDVTKDMGGGYGMGVYHGLGGLRGKIIRRLSLRDRRPVALHFANLAGIFRQLGHTVEYQEETISAGADLYVFNPSIITIDLEREAIKQVLAVAPQARVLVTGVVGHTMPEAFADLDVTIVYGETEQLFWRLDEVLAATGSTVEVGSVEHLDSLPLPDWSLFQPGRFRIGYDFTKFPTAFIQQSRGCTFTCNYCPYIVIENRTRFRSPESVVEEMRRGMRDHGFRSFKFRDPLFGLNRRRVLELADLIGRLPRKIQFSIESRIELMRRETLVALRDVGLTSVTVGIETPNDQILSQYRRKPIREDHQHRFLATCRELGIRSVAGFMIGFPEDTASSIRSVLNYAKKLNPTFANFNIVTPYPGTPFYREMQDKISSESFTKYNMYTPVMQYEHLTREEVLALHAKCFTSYYFRWTYLLDNMHLLWPVLRKLGVGRRFRTAAASSSPPQVEQNAKADHPLPLLSIKSTKGPGNEVGQGDAETTSTDRACA